jgi:hypothetical protein
MISTEPLIAAEEQTSLYGKVMAYVDQIRKQANDGLTFAELCELVVAGMRLTIAAVDELDLAGPTKKQIVADCAVEIFTEFSDLMVPLPLRPLWWIIKPALRTLVHTAAAGAVDALLPVVRLAET